MKIPVMTNEKATPPPLESAAPIPTGRVDRILRVGRALVGWVPEEQALLLLSSNDASGQPTDDQRATATSARGAVAARSAGVDQTDVVKELPAALDAHVAKLKDSPAAAPFFAEGWMVSLVDLARVCAYQPSVLTDSGSQRVAGVDPADLDAIAAVTLPTDWAHELNAQFNPARNHWVLASRNPNLRVVGRYAGPVQEGGVPVFGFFATVTPSFLQVARYQGRYFLRDGYHRAVGLLGIGARWAPAFVRDMDSFQQLMPDPAGMIPQEAILGDRPPVLADYADDTVAATVQVPAVQKMVVVQALELTPQG